MSLRPAEAAGQDCEAQRQPCEKKVPDQVEVSKLVRACESGGNQSDAGTGGQRQRQEYQRGLSRRNGRFNNRIHG